MRFLTIDENSKWLSSVQKLGDDSRLTLGFMPAQAFVDYAKRKQILGLIINGELVAYTMFRYKKTSLIIVHFCVSTKHRGHGFAKKLMSALYQQEKDYVSQFKLSCRRDYNLDKFWYSLGFVPMAEKLYAEVKDYLLSLKYAEEYSNTWHDISHISYAIAFEADVFITRDTTWLNTAISDAVFERYGFRILSPAELIRHIDEIDSPSSYSPQKLVGLNLEYSEMKTEDFSVVSDTFYQQYLSGKKRFWSKNQEISRLRRPLDNENPRASKFRFFHAFCSLR